jgi:membrane protease YdiL (CAAX protease family)
MPVWDIFETRRLKARRGDARAKVQSYAKTIGVLWLAALSAWAISGVRIFQTPSLRAALPLLTRGTAPETAAGLVAGAAIGLLALPLVAARSAILRAKLARPYAKLDFFLPTRPAEFRLFPLVCVTAGVCEEVLFRAFLLNYFFTESAFRFGAWTAIAAACVVFGIAHFYQGFAGVIVTALLGFGLAMLYLWTGNLAAPMVLHALIDLRVWLVLWLNRDAEPVHAPSGLP